MSSSSHPGLEVIREYVEGQARLGYENFDPGPRPDDVILATFPKSGSTWSSYLLHQIRSAGDDDFDDIKHEVVDITPGHWPPGRQPFIGEQRFFPRTYKTHGSYRRCPKGAKYIYVSRNPKDIFWSFYKFLHDLLGITETVPVDLFYAHVFRDRFHSGHDIGNVWDHLLGWRGLFGHENLLWLHYEDLVEQRETAIATIARFMGVELSHDDTARVVRHSQMDHMRGIAEKINPSPDNYVGRIVAGFGNLTNNYARQMRFGKLRRGIPGDGRRNLPEEIAQEIEKEWRARIAPELGFSDYDAMRSASPLKTA